ncbi:MAG: DPP IV N-terminal domain-containing protein [Candidatus Glassbacteria bacterium]
MDKSLHILTGVLLCLSAARLPAELVITSPAAGSTVYSAEALEMEAAWSGPPPEGLALVWKSSADGVLGNGLRLHVPGLSYASHRITVQATAGDSVVAEAETLVYALSRPEQFTLSERTDWEGEFSPRGNQVAYTSYRNGDPEIWIATVSNRFSERITFKGGLSPSWTPDGRMIAFWSERSGNRDIWLVGLAGDQKNAIQLTGTPGPEWMPAVNRADGRILFTAKEGRNLRLMVLDTAAPDPVPMEVVGPDHYPMFGRWFPDGKDILFTSYRHSTPVVCRYSAATGAVVEVSDPGAEDADISPDGRRIVIVRNSEIWLENLAGGGARPLTADRAGALNPRFSPDGAKIIYASTRSGNYDLWLLDLPSQD